ncbi:hypothetical protein BD413DRAFT_213298 [Trametes elegans]|nr:hypothetical protein BD413DRAFT_213298 [Trametes elegans]
MYGQDNFGDHVFVAADGYGVYLSFPPGLSEEHSVVNPSCPPSTGNNVVPYLPVVGGYNMPPMEQHTSAVQPQMPPYTAWADSQTPPGSLPLNPSQPYYTFQNTPHNPTFEPNPLDSGNAQPADWPGTLSTNDQLPDTRPPPPEHVAAENVAANSSKRKKIHQCPVCGHFFKTKYNKKQHVDSVHLKLKPFVCSYCQKAFTRNHEMKKHINKNHMHN